MKNKHQLWLLLSKNPKDIYPIPTQKQKVTFPDLSLLNHYKIRSTVNLFDRKNNIQYIQPKNCKEIPNWKPACKSGKQKTR